MSGTQQFKKIAFLAPRPGMAREEFLAYWRNVHGPTVAGAPDYARFRRRYVQNHYLRRGPIGDDFSFGGMAEFWLPGANEETFAESPTYRDHIQPDERRFIDMDATISMTAVEHVIHEGDDPIKLVLLVGGLPEYPGSDGLVDTVRLATTAAVWARCGLRANLVLRDSFRLPGARAVGRLPIDLILQAGLPTEGASVDLRDELEGIVHPLRSKGADLSICSFEAREIVFFDSRSDTP